MEGERNMRMDKLLLASEKLTNGERRVANIRFKKGN